MQIDSADHTIRMKCFCNSGFAVKWELERAKEYSKNKRPKQNFNYRHSSTHTHTHFRINNKPIVALIKFIALTLNSIASQTSKCTEYRFFVAAPMRVCICVSGILVLHTMQMENGKMWLGLPIFTGICVHCIRVWYVWCSGVNPVFQCDVRVFSRSLSLSLSVSLSFSRSLIVIRKTARSLWLLLLVLQPFDSNLIFWHYTYRYFILNLLHLFHTICECE